ncbi:hypothetical protein CCP3SC15_3370002 [Gammaproteobacteria bacterium]
MRRQFRRGYETTLFNLGSGLNSFDCGRFSRLRHIALIVHGGGVLDLDLIVTDKLLRQDKLLIVYYLNLFERWVGRVNG